MWSGVRPDGHIWKSICQFTSVSVGANIYIYIYNIYTYYIQYAYIKIMSMYTCFQYVLGGLADLNLIATNLAQIYCDLQDFLGPLKLCGLTSEVDL